MTKQPAPGRAGVAPSPAHCGVCGHRAVLRQATRDATQLCPECWDGYEASCDEEDAYWQSQAHPDGAPQERERCQRGGIKLLPNEHTRAQGICHSCWADDMGAAAQDPLNDGAALPCRREASCDDNRLPARAPADLLPWLLLVADYAYQQ